VGVVARSSIRMARHSNGTCFVRGGNSTCKTEVARRCGCRHNPSLFLPGCDPAIQIDCDRVSRAPFWSQYCNSSLPTLACMVFARSICGILRLVGESRYERVSYYGQERRTATDLICAKTSSPTARSSSRIERRVTLATTRSFPRTSRSSADDPPSS